VRISIAHYWCLIFVVTAIGVRPRPEICFLPGWLGWTLLPKERYGDLLSGRGSNDQPSNWEGQYPQIFSISCRFVLREAVCQTEYCCSLK